MNDLESIIQQAENDSMFWDATLPQEGKSIYKTSIPGLIVEYIMKNQPDPDMQNQTIGLMATNAARRALACWFVYCDDTQPLLIVNQLLQYWSTSSPSMSIAPPVAYPHLSYGRR